jgi:hypothetical protein
MTQMADFRPERTFSRLLWLAPHPCLFEATQENGRIVFFVFLDRAIKLYWLHAPFAPSKSFLMAKRVTATPSSWGETPEFWKFPESRQVPVEMDVCSSQPFSSQSGIVDAM